MRNKTRLNLKVLRANQIPIEMPNILPNKSAQNAIQSDLKIISIPISNSKVQKVEIQICPCQNLQLLSEQYLKM